MGAYFCMGAYKRDVVVVIRMGAYIQGVLICVGAYYPDFTVSLIHEKTDILNSSQAYNPSIRFINPKWDTHNTHESQDRA